MYRLVTTGLRLIIPLSLRGPKVTIPYHQPSLAPLRSVQFSSVQFSSVQFSSVQFSSVQFSYSPTFLEHLCTCVRHSCHGYADARGYLAWTLLGIIFFLRLLY